MRRPHVDQRPRAARPDRDVLLIEADPEQQVELAHVLRSEGHRVVAASSAAGALALMASFEVDLVIVSQELPQTTGVDVTCTLLSQHPGLRIVLLTNEGSPGLTAAAITAGAHDCASRHELRRLLERWLRDRGGVPLSTRPSLDEELPATAQSAE